MTEKKCPVCKSMQENNVYVVRERLLNKGDKFNYMLCSKCGSLFLLDDVDVSDFYPNNYYAFQILKKSTHECQIKNDIKLLLAKAIISGRTPHLLLNIGKFPMKYLHCLWGTRLPLNPRICDIGGGNGKWLNMLKDIGVSDNLTNVDLLAGNCAIVGIEHICGTALSIPENRKYDLIAMHHSFEHMDNPHEVLEKCYSLLDDNGTIIIRVPVISKKWWEKYGCDWWQIDAPRHIILYSENALKDICRMHGLNVERVTYDSDFRSILISDFYKNTNWDLNKCDIESRKIVNKRIIRTVNVLNKKGEGEQAVFFIKKIKKSNFS